jgi:hypothetical protein
MHIIYPSKISCFQPTLSAMDASTSSPLNQSGNGAVFGNPFSFEVQARDENPLRSATFTELSSFVDRNYKDSRYFGVKRLGRKERGEIIANAFDKLTVKKTKGCCKPQKNQLLTRLPDYACCGWSCPLCWFGKKDACGADRIMFGIASNTFPDGHEIFYTQVGQSLAYYILEALPKLEEEQESSNQ